MNEIKVKIPAVKASSYTIKIGANILESLWEQIDSAFKEHNKFVVTDSNLVSAGHLTKLIGQRDVETYVIEPPGETSKNINTLTSIIEAMEKACLGRDTVVIALGGGTVGDIAGFAASIFKRGVPVVQIPTTTVAQADSSVGGKTGVDSTISKNAFGTFWHPAAVYIDVALLDTLDDRQFRAGLVESVKHALIADAKYFDYLETNIDAILQREPDVLEKMACFNCRIKASVAQADPTEKNQRRMLNYGHTVGHAVESASGFDLLHGEAISIGIIAAGLIEIEMGLAKTDRLDRVKSILKKLNMPITLPLALTKEQILGIIRMDKKAVNKWPKFALIEKIGRIHRQNEQWAHDVDQQIVEKVLDKLYE